MIIKFNDENSRFIEANASVVRLDDGTEWFFFPYVYLKIKDGIFEEKSFQNLPPSVKIKVQEKETELPKKGLTLVMKKTKD